MKKYKLLKDMPFAKAGEEFDDQYEDGILTFYHQNRTIDIYKADIENFDEWFEEIEEPNEYFYITSDRFVDSAEKEDEYLKQRRKSFGNYFETREEAGEHLSYLKAKAIIKQDAKGFKPDWNNKYEPKYWGYWDFYNNKLDRNFSCFGKRTDIYFKSREELEESFKKHPEEWKTYLTYEQ